MSMLYPRGMCSYQVVHNVNSMVHPHSAAGKILRRELRERAKLEVGKVKAKL